ncbi:hypothetical protein CDL15_Pgr015759 [Punica granatum]|uniref:Uncharacterized protein n=1 Tax=Punica granatum TaxID=22663 RepID=A0A218XP42_PUNGR|nr:hypothetical protein CDL15_Pgr015759 [Punica granatum]
MAQVKRSWPEERKRVHAIGDGYDDEYEVRAAEIVADKPVNCPSLVRARGGKGLVKFGTDHKHPMPEEIKNKDFCRIHGSWKHSTKECYEISSKTS